MGKEVQEGMSYDERFSEKKLKKGSLIMGFWKGNLRKEVQEEKFGNRKEVSEEMPEKRKYMKGSLNRKGILGTGYKEI